MKKLTREDLFSLEKYAQIRPDFRAQVIAHKKNRQIRLGEHTTLCFEDRLTIQYQVQEMLRIERIFETAGIEEELSAYNPLIPDGSNWKATLLIEYPDVQERAVALRQLKGIETCFWVAVADGERIKPIADEDLSRENAEKTAAVHFLRFELPPTMITRLKAGETLTVGVEHPAYTYSVQSIPEATRAALVADLE